MYIVSPLIIWINILLISHMSKTIETSEKKRERERDLFSAWQVALLYYLFAVIAY